MVRAIRRRPDPRKKKSSRRKLCNLQRDSMGIAEEAIERVGLKIKIVEEVKDQEGNVVSELIALFTLEPENKDLSSFWREFRKLKGNSLFKK